MTGADTVRAARLACSRASYPGEGVAVGGTAMAGAADARPPSTTSAAMAEFAQNRFISFLPALVRITPDRRHFKAAPSRGRIGIDLHRTAPRRNLRAL
jgi:hypothetical protein